MEHAMEGSETERVQMQETHFGGKRVFSTLRPTNMVQTSWARASQPAILAAGVRRWDAPLPILGMVNTNMVTGYSTNSGHHML
jgi:hypothetical protein